MKKCIALLMCIGVCFLTACSSGGVPMYMRNPEIQALSYRQLELLRKIKDSHIGVVKRGMVFEFSIPTDQYFSSVTRKLRTNREQDLFHLAHFLLSYGQYFSHPKITVTGHTDKIWLYPARKLLSMHYAQSVAMYLSQAGVPSDLMKVSGRGAKGAVASNEYPDAAAYNRRVVVVIR